MTRGPHHGRRDHQGESLALRWQDIDLDAGDLIVRHTLQRRSRELAEPKTAKARRQIALDDTTDVLLRAHEASQRLVRLDRDFVFATIGGEPLDPRNVLRSFHAALDRAGLPRRAFHQLRHAFATLLVEAGEELVLVSKVLGHADLSTTADLYGHLTPKMTRRASERIGAILAC